MKYSLQLGVSAAALVVAALCAPLHASAQAQPGSVPSYAVPGAAPAPAPVSRPVPTYASPNREESVRGTVASYDGRYALQVRDRAGYLDNIRLHQGTVINPTGLRLQNGMHVTVYGYNAGRTFAANEIDTDVQPVVWAPYPYPYSPVHIGLRFGYWGRW